MDYHPGCYCTLGWRLFCGHAHYGWAQFVGAYIGQTSTLPAGTAVSAGANRTGRIGATGTSGTGTVQIQPASAVVKEVSASGHIEALAQTNVAMVLSYGTINKVYVSAGDVVTAGQVLMSLDTTDLERALARAQIAVDTAINKQAQTSQTGHGDGTYFGRGETGFGQSRPDRRQDARQRRRN